MAVNAPSFLFNNVTQRILSQSNNVSYAARGIYRVHETEGPRKGDYWFRDFGMVMACAYMTELGFRAADTRYAIPLLTEALQLHQLSENPLYKNARNYDTLPSLVRQRVMGSLINKSSASLVPNLMKELELRQGAQLEGDLRAKVEKMLQSPTGDAEKTIAEYLKAHNLSTHAEAIRRISAVENPAKRADAIQQLLGQHRTLTAAQVENAVKLEDARQLGILVDHLHRHLNLTEYLKNTYLSNHKLSGTVSDVIKNYADKLAVMQTKGKAGKDSLPALLDDIYKLPVAKRQEAFDKKFQEILESLELKKGVLLASREQYKELQDIGAAIRPLLKEPNPPRDLKAITERIEAFYKGLTSPESQQAHLRTLWDNAHGDLKARLGKKLDEALESLQTLTPGQDRHAALEKKLNELNLTPFLRETGQENALQDLKKAIARHLPKNSGDHVAEDALQKARGEISNFMRLDSFGTIDRLLKPLVGKLGDHPEQAFKHFVEQSLKSKRMTDTIRKIQGNSTWPKMAATVLLNLIFYGFAASNFDNKVLQPFQKKLTAERGGAQDIVTSGYLATIPALAVLTQLFDRVSVPFMKDTSITVAPAFIRRMGYFTRFAAVGGAALATFAGSTYAILMHRLQQSPAHKAPTNPNPAPTSSASFHRPTGGAPMTMGSFPTTQPHMPPRTGMAPNGFALSANMNTNYAWPHRDH